MATKRNTKSDFAPAPKGFRSFKNDGAGLAELNEGGQITGTYLGRTRRTLKDKRSRVPGATKEVWIYKIRGEDGKVFSLGGRTILDSLFDDLLMELFNGDENQPRGLGITINRGTDETTQEGNPMGTYEILIQDPAQAE